MKKIKKNILKILSIIVLMIIAFSFGLLHSDKNKEEITSKLIENKLISVSELTSVKYNYTNMGSFENSNTFYGYKIPFTSKKFIVAYDGSINAGVNLENMDIKIAGKKITINLPKAKVLSHEIYEDSLKIFDEKNSIFNPIKIEDYNNFSKSQKEKVEKNAIAKGLLEEADEKASTSIKNILNIDGVLKDYEIIITQK